MTRIPSSQTKSLSELSQALSAGNVGQNAELRAKGKASSGDGVVLYSKTGAKLVTNKAARAAHQQGARTAIADALSAEFKDLKGAGAILAGVVQKNMRQVFEGQGAVTRADLENVLGEAQRVRKDFTDFSAAKTAHANDPSYLAGKGDYKATVKDVPGFAKDQTLFNGIEQYARLLSGPKPLSADSLKQMGALESWIKEKNFCDMDARALERATKALESAADSGAESVKVLPQSVALRQIGGAHDQAGRCLPMVALAALAESSGPNGMDGFVQRFEQEVQEMHTAGQRDQTAFVGHLAAMHGTVPLASSSDYIKDTAGKNIKSIGHRDAVQHLASNPDTTQGKPVFYGLTVPRHIMMIGATKHEGKESFMFFDPNFGVARFPSADKLSKFLDSYFGDLEYGDEYAMDHETNGRGLVAKQYDLDLVAKVPVDNLPATDPKHETMMSLTSPKPTA